MWLKIAYIAIPSVILSVSYSHAQDISNVSSYYDRSRHVDVRERPHPEYEQLGIREGGFLIYPEADVGLLYDDNIYARSANVVGDEGLDITGTVRAKSQWSSNSLNAFATISNGQYFHHSSENDTIGAVGVDGRLDYDRSFFGTATASYASDIEPRTAISAAPDAVNPIRYELGVADFAVTKEFERIKITSDLDFNDYTYENGRVASGAVLDQQYRSHDEIYLNGAVSYAVSPNTAFFVAGQYSDFSYIQNGVGALNRNSDGFHADVGVDFDLSGPFRGKIQAGYLEQTFDATGLKNVDGYDASGTLKWFPTQLTTVTTTISRAIQDSGILTAPAYLSTTVTARVDHELFRNVILGAQYTYQEAVFQGIQRTDDVSSASLTAEYVLNRGIGVLLDYEYIDQKSAGVDVGPEFTDNRVTLTTRLKY